MEARVLIVEDEALIALHLQQLVEDAGHRVVGIAFDTEEAKSIARTERPHFAFVDMRLRNGSSGIDVGRHLREEYDVPSILVSANLDGFDTAAALDFRPIALIGKPFMPVTISGAIDLAVAMLKDERK